MRLWKYNRIKKSYEKDRKLENVVFDKFVISPQLLSIAPVLFFTTHGKNVLMTQFRYVGISRAYTNGFATELNAESQTPAMIERHEH